MQIKESSFLGKISAFFPSFLLTLTSLLNTYSKTYVVSSPEHIGRLLIILWIFLVIIIWLGYKLTRNWQLVGFLLSVFVIGFYLTEAFSYLVIFFSGLVFGAWFLFTYILKKKRETIQMTYLSNVIVITLLLLSGIRLFPAFLLVDWPIYWNTLANSKISLPIPETVPENKPDIYYIILDSYGRSDILQEYYHYDNSEFIKYLTNKGFVVPLNIHSNYPMTTLSVPSTLNMEYTQNIVSGTDDSYFWWLMGPYVEENRVQLFLKNSGYQSISISTGWDVTNNTSTDLHFKTRAIHLDQFERFFLAETPIKIFRPLLEKIAFLSTYNSHRELILYNFETLANVSKIPGPKFVFAHIEAPHPPFVFDRDGTYLTPAYNFSIADGDSFPGTDNEYRAAYVGQVEFINGKLQKTIDIILAQSQTPPIIILQADHGPRMLNAPQSLDQICPNEAFSIFAAFYLPGLKKSPIPDEITPVNIFRIVLNEYFSTHLPLLENISYSNEDSIRVYRTQNIQSRLTDKCELQP